jgi:hypothetical protein
VSRGAFPAVIGTVYMPMAFPAVGAIGTREADVSTVDDYNPLRTAHEAEYYQFRHEKARAALRAEMDAKQRVLSRMGTATPSDSTTCTDLDKRITDLKTSIDKLNDRLTSVEKLVLIHDAYLKELQKKMP